MKTVEIVLVQRRTRHTRVKSMFMGNHNNHESGHSVSLCRGERGVKTWFVVVYECVVCRTRSGHQELRERIGRRSRTESVDNDFIKSLGVVSG